jgi:hypothetical protein
MRILVDADACPVKEIIVRTARRYSIEVIMFVNTCHVINDGYSTVVTVDQHSDSVDYAIANSIKPGDIIVTQDHGLAALVMSPKNFVISQNGFIYDNSNIDSLLSFRHESAKVRRSGGRTPNPKKRTAEEDEKFEKTLIKLLSNVL